MKFDVRSAIQFAAVAEELSFRRAAERLRVAQPWLSTRIRQLEEQLGFPLFIRSTRMVELTEAGRVFLKDAAALAAAARAAEETAQMLQNQKFGRLRIGVPPYHASLQQQSALIRQFIGTRPFASIELDVGWSPILLGRLIERNLDLAFVLDSTADPSLEYMTIGLADPILVIHSSEELAERQELRLEDLRGCEIAVFTRGLNPILYDKLFGPYEAAGAKLLQVPEFGDLDVRRRRKPPFRVFATFGWAGDQAPDAPGVVIRRFVDYRPQISLNLVRQKTGANKLQEEFWQMARSYIQAAACREPIG